MQMCKICSLLRAHNSWIALRGGAKALCKKSLKIVQQFSLIAIHSLDWVKQEFQETTPLCILHWWIISQKHHFHSLFNLNLEKPSKSYMQESLCEAQPASAPWWLHIRISRNATTSHLTSVDNFKNASFDMPLIIQLNLKAPSSKKTGEARSENPFVKKSQPVLDGGFTSEFQETPPLNILHQ